MSKKLFELNRRYPQVMAILNVTPDSFFDGGNCFTGNSVNLDICRFRVENMISEGATIIDVGGESTRPGAQPISIAEEMHRVLPVIEAIADYDIVISLDSSSPEVMQEAAKLGIGLINDVRALQRSNAVNVAAATGLPVCLMHMQGQPKTMQKNPEYRSLLDTLSSFFEERINACLAVGIIKNNLLIDPGFGFGKTLEHNIDILRQLEFFGQWDLPILVGLSRKTMISDMLHGRSVDQRLIGSIALAVMAVERGAWIVRAHDIKETVDAITIAAAIMER